MKVEKTRLADIISRAGPDAAARIVEICFGSTYVPSSERSPCP